MYTQRDAHHGVHVEPRKIAAAANLLQSLLQLADLLLLVHGSSI